MDGNGKSSAECKSNLLDHPDVKRNGKAARQFAAALPAGRSSANTTRDWRARIVEGLVREQPSSVYRWIVLADPLPGIRSGPGGSTLRRRRNPAAP